MFEKDSELLKFEPNYPYILPQDWDNKDAPTVYEIMATLNTLKKMYSEQVNDIENKLIDKNKGENNLISIATNYQTIKSILFQSR